MENGKAALAIGLKNGLGCGTTELHILRPCSRIEAKYLYHFVHQESFRKEAARRFTGTAGQLRVPVSFIRNAEIPLPPTNEQRCIVAKLEKLLAKVEASQERLNKIPTLLKRFRQSVLAAACSGRLTADWRDAHIEYKPDKEEEVVANGLTLSVAVDGLLKEAFPRLAMPSAADRRNISEAQDIIRNSSIDSKVKARLNGFIGTMSNPRAKDRLRVFLETGILDNKLTDSWESLRNPSTHGDVADWRDLQRYIDKCSSTLVLFYQLIFLVIEYTGKFTNYSCEGYPTVLFDKRLT